MNMVYGKYLAGLALDLARCSYDREQLGLAAAVEAAIPSLPSLPDSATARKSLPSLVTATNSSLALRSPSATSGPAQHMLIDSTLHTGVQRRRQQWDDDKWFGVRFPQGHIGALPVEDKLGGRRVVECKTPSTSIIAFLPCTHHLPYCKNSQVDRQHK